MKKSATTGAGRRKTRKKPAGAKKTPRKATPKKKPVDPSKPLKNARWEAFALDVFGGMTPTDAYRKHYSTERMKAKTVHEKASRLKGKVRARIEFFQSKVASKRIMSKTELAEMYSDICRTRHSDFLTMSADGVWMHDIGEETLGQVALKKAKTRITTDKGAGTVIHEKQFDEIELESKVAAGRALAELMEYNAPQKHELSGPNGGPQKHEILIGVYHVDKKKA